MSVNAIERVVASPLRRSDIQGRARKSALKVSCPPGPLSLITRFLAFSLRQLLVQDPSATDGEDVLLMGLELRARVVGHES